MYNDVIGVLGGMGSYATLHFFETLLNSFPAEKEWDRPRIIIDNRCTMPSRVLAVLEGVKYEQLVKELSDSISSLLYSGATKIILACNTSHCFLPDIYEAVPEAKGKIVNIIEACAKTVASCGEDHIGLIASEGTISSGVFEKELEKYNIKVTYPKNEDFLIQRELIEAVKQNKITEGTITKFIKLLENSSEQAMILGCTEFPVIYSRISKEELPNIRIYDPLCCAIEEVKKICG